MNSRRFFILLLILSILVSGCFYPALEISDQDPALEMVILDVGQGDSILIISPSGKTMLVDGGRTEDAAEDVILAYLRRKKIRSLDVMVLTHPDADHVGGLTYLLSRIPVSSVVMTGQNHTTKVYAGFLEAVKKFRDRNGMQVIRGVAGVEIPFDSSVNVQILAPDEEAIRTDDKNNASIVIRLTYLDTGILLTGDAETEEEQWILDREMDISSDVLKVSHHGSGSSSLDEFLEAVGAEIGVISCGRDNSYNHPDPEVLDRLARHNMEVYSTDTQGTIKITLKQGADGKCRIVTETAAR